MDLLSSNVARSLSELIDGSQQVLVKRFEEKIEKLENNCRELTQQNASLKQSLESLTHYKESLDKLNTMYQDLTKDNTSLRESLNQVTQAKDMLAREQAEWMKLGTTLATSVRDLQTFTGELDNRLKIIQKQVLSTANSHLQPDPYRHQLHHPNEMILELTRQAGKLKGEIDVLNNLQRSFDSGSRNQSFTTTM